MAEGAAHGVEEHQVTGLQLGLVDGLGGGGLFVGAAGEQQANGLLVHGAHKTAAVKTRVHGVATAGVWNTHKTHGVEHDARRLVGHAVAHIVQPGQQIFICQQAVHVVLGGEGGCLAHHTGEREREGTEPLCHGGGGYHGMARDKLIAHHFANIFLCKGVGQDALSPQNL